MSPRDRRALVLASASPRRRDLLSSAGLEFSIDPSNFDEDSIRHLSPRRQALVAARGKALDVSHRHPMAWVIGADTVVDLDGIALGKPSDTREASRMMKALAGHDHSVHSALCVVTPDGGRASALASSRVRFASLTRDQVRAYVAGGEPIGKAGGYAIQGDAGQFAHVVRGRRDTVIGLSMRLLARLLGQLGHPAAKGLSDNLDPS